MASSPRPQRHSRGGSVRQRRRCRRAPPTAARTRRPGSCPPAGSRRSCRRWPRRSGRAAWWRRARRARPGGTRGREPGHVGDQPAADGDHAVGAGEPPRRERRHSSSTVASVLCASPSPIVKPRCSTPGSTSMPMPRLGDDGDPAGAAPAARAASSSTRAGAHQHRVRPVAERHLDGDHASASTIRSTTSSGPSAPASTRTSATSA